VGGRYGGLYVRHAIRQASRAVKAAVDMFGPYDLLLFHEQYPTDLEAVLRARGRPTRRRITRSGRAISPSTISEILLPDAGDPGE